MSESKRELNPVEAERYRRNRGALTASEQEKLARARVLVVGCGGLGGYVIEELGRLGVGVSGQGFLTAVDGDAFEPSNLNRQILATASTLGENKALAAARRMAVVNPEIDLRPRPFILTAENARELVAGHDLAIDALDRISCRLLLEATCEEAEIPLVHGAVSGWWGQAAVVLPGDRTLEKLYRGYVVGEERCAEESSAPVFAPAVVASLEVAEAVKLIIGRGEILRHCLLTVDLLNHEYDRVGLAGAL